MNHDLTPHENGIKYFIISWDCQGVEHIEDVTKYHPAQWAKTHLFDSIKNGESAEPNKLTALVSMLTLRAQFNPQRHYEIYLFTADEGIRCEDFQVWADDDPQSLVDTVRKNYVKQIYSDRIKADDRKII